jgi:hypothetical protein
MDSTLSAVAVVVITLVDALGAGCLGVYLEHGGDREEKG